MQQETGIAAVAHVIQLSVAPVFLLSGIGAMLAVMTNRLSRVIDRARELEGRLSSASSEDAKHFHGELGTLSRRAKMINNAITLCTATALLVCAVIAALFLGAFAHFDASVPVGVLFLTAMLAFFAGLVWFLREIFLATASLRIGTHESRHQ
jgi:hypothetical protein